MMTNDPKAALRRAKMAAATLSFSDIAGAERLANDLADLPTLLSLDSADRDDIEWVVRELESLYERHPASEDIAAAFARSLVIFVENDQPADTVERKMRRLELLSTRHLGNERVRAGVAWSLSNIALSRQLRPDIASLSGEAGRRLEAVFGKYPNDDRIATHMSLLLQDRIRFTSDSTERAAATRRIHEIALLHPGNETIGAVRNLVRGSDQAKAGCYVATAVYGSYNCPEVWVLRRFRDRSLARTRAGRIAIRAYYATSPPLVRLLGNARWFPNLVRRPLDALVTRLERAGFEAAPYSDETRA